MYHLIQSDLCDQVSVHVGMTTTRQKNREKDIFFKD